MSYKVIDKKYSFLDDDEIYNALKEDIDPIVEEAIEKEEFTPYKAEVTAAKLNVRASSSFNAKVQDIITKGTLVQVFEENNNFGRIGDKSWICLDFIKKI